MTTHSRSRPAPECSAISVVIPVFNERESLAELCARLSRVLGEMRVPTEILFVDDGSTDGSLDRIKELRRESEMIRYVRFRRNFGKSAALAAGFRAARYPVVVTMDADLQDQPEQLPLLLEKLDEGCDLVSGWRHKRHDKLTRRIGSKIYNVVTARMTGVRLHDINCGFKCYRREVLDEVRVYGEQHRYIPVLASYRGFKLGEAQVDHAPRAHGRSRYGPGRVVGGVFSLLTVILLTRYTNKPLHFFGLLGVGLGLIGSLIDLYLIADRILFRRWLSNRPLLIIGTLLIIVGVQFILFGLLAEMIAFSFRRDSDYAIEDTSELQSTTPAVSGIRGQAIGGD